jgi:hypothetical protein
MNSKEFIKNIKYWNWISYKNDHIDLKNLSEDILLQHVLKHGLNEDRNIIIDENNTSIISRETIENNISLLLPEGFNSREYINLNNDLKYLSEDDAIYHYVLHGNSEGRNYRNYKVAQEKINNNEKVLIINPIFGLGNRLRAIASAYSISKHKNMKLVINWIPDYHCDCLIEDLIVNIHNYGEVIYNQIDNESLIDFELYNYLEVDEEGKKDEYINDNYNKIYVKSNCVLNNEYSYIHFYEFLQSLKWNDYINNLINSIPDIYNYIGMHIRMEGGNEYQNIDADKSSNWTERETELMFKYREISHVDNFINKINDILHENPEKKFFIATDMKCNYDKLINIYGHDKIKILERNLFNRSKEQQYYAIADIILLSRCCQFYGSSWSSFSELVTHFQKEQIKTYNIFSETFQIQNLSKRVNYLNKNLKEGNSIVCVSMNRSENILKVLPSWLKINNCDEIIILDFGSKERLLDVLKSHNFNDEKINIYRVDNVSKWHLSKAYNLAIKLVSYKNIYKLDSDDICNSNLIDNHPLNESNIYYHGKWQDAKCENELQIAGKMFFNYNMFVDSNGYNENISTYGWDDCDFDERLNKIGIQKPICINDFVFIEHGDDIRQEKQNDNNISPEQHIHINRLLCEENILSWSNKYLHTEFVINNENIFNENKSYHLTYNFINKDKLSSISEFCKGNWK